MDKTPWCFFVDTNIFLDFYRLGGESAKRQLAALDRHRASLMRTEQIRMEFLKNRQRVILDSIGKICKPQKMTMPPIFANSQPARGFAKNHEDAVKLFKRMSKKIEDILSNPGMNDLVYKSLKKIFAAEDAFNLTPDHVSQSKIEERAKRRFSLGYPPRKNADTSFGDAINWEWIVECALTSDANSNVMIVSRDSDFGVTRGTETILNDWLAQEFKERVSQKRKIVLTNKLTTALKRLEEQVTVEDVKQEEKLLEQDTADSDLWRKLITNAAIQAGGKADLDHWEGILAALRTHGDVAANKA